MGLNAHASLWIADASAAWPDAPGEMTVTTLGEIESSSRRWALSAGHYPDLWNGRGYPAARPTRRALWHRGAPCPRGDHESTGPGWVSVAPRSHRAPGHEGPRRLHEGRERLHRPCPLASGKQPEGTARPRVRSPITVSPGA